MADQVPAGTFPTGFPAALADEAFVHSGEAAWRPPQAVQAINWLCAHGYAVLGTEVWLPQGKFIQSVPYFQNVDRNVGEEWNSFVTRAAAETVAYVKAFEQKFAEEGDVFLNVTWVSEAEFQCLKAT